MSDRAKIEARAGGWQNPHTGSGSSLDEGPAATAAAIVCHECGYSPRICHWNFDAVRSPFWRLYLDGAPGAWLECGEQRVRLDERHVVVVPEDVEFNCRSRRERPHLWVHFSFDSYVRLSEAAPLRLPLSAGQAAVVAELRSALQRPETGAMALAHLSHALVHLVVGRLPLMMSAAMTPRLAETLAFLHRVPAERVTNGDLARRAGLGLRTFLALFRQETGDTPAHYLQALRLREAARRLVMTPASIEEIAAACGFANRHYFTRQFAVHFGSGPAAFRRAAGRAPK